MKKIIIAFLIFAGAYQANSQVLISLLFGDKLNSPNVEFGLDGGINFARMSGFESYNMYRKYNLGFYFTLRLKQSQHWFLRTGVMVKSDRGTNKLTEADVKKLDSTFYVGNEGTYSQRLGYFDVPVLLRYRFGFKGYVELGGQVSLRNRAELNFDYKEGDDELVRKRNNKDQVNAIDGGILVGVGYQLRDTKSLGFEVWFYQGMANVYKDISGIHSQTITLKVTIPVGAGKAEKKAKEN